MPYREQEPDDLPLGRQTPPTEVAVKLTKLGWSSLAQVAGDEATVPVAYFKLECDQCGYFRRLRPERGGRCPDDWGPAHVCKPAPVEGATR